MKFKGGRALVLGITWTMLSVLGFHVGLDSAIPGAGLTVGLLLVAVAFVVDDK